MYRPSRQLFCTLSVIHVSGMQILVLFCVYPVPTYHCLSFKYVCLMEHNTTMSSWITLYHSIKEQLMIWVSRAPIWHNDIRLRRALYHWQADWFIRALISQAIWLLLLIGVAGQADPLVVYPSTVSVGSYLPPEGSTNNVGLASPNGMFNLHIQTWRDLPAFYCMAGVVNVKTNPGSMLWGANNAQPLMVSSTCTLFLSLEGDLLLQYDDGHQTAWQTHTAGMGVSNLTLHNSGNLVLHTRQGFIVWQSFTQSPAFALNSGMNLTSNMTIYSSAPIVNGATNFNIPGSFAMQLHNHSTLVLFTNTNDSSSRFVYWSTSFTNFSLSHANSEQVSYVALDDAFTFYDSSSLALGSIAPAFTPPYNSSSALRVAVLDPPSANLLAFYRSNHTWVLFYNSSLGVCENPMQCGNFGLCNVSTGACSCPPGFLQNLAHDCELETSPSTSCSSLAFRSVEASSYRFVSVNVSFPPQLSAMSSPSADHCTNLCVDSCVCKAALFDPGTSSCSLFSSLQALPTRSDSKQLMLLKIVAEQHYSTKKRFALILGVTCAAILVSLCLICAIATICCAKRRRKRNSSSKGAPNEDVFLQALPRLPPRYTYKELDEATKQFSRKLGAGGFGAVYEGVLPSGMKVAVKKLEEGSGQSSAQFRAEVASIGSVSHVNLVTLKGFCHEGDGRLLVYEHMGKGSLDRWLFKGGEDKGKELGWERRCKIAMDTAKGLAYLHHECTEKIVHCDVKPENILLDEKFNAKVGDFGLAKLVGHGRQSFAMTTLKGTRGYLAPEWLQHATITAKSDVYSFGIVLLELISGRRCLDSDYGYLPTLAFRIVSTSSSSSAHPKLRESHRKEGVSCLSMPAPLVEQQPIQGFLRSYEKVTGSKESLSLPPEPLQGFAISHNTVSGSQGCLSPPPKPIPVSLTSQERVAAASEECSPHSPTTHKRVTGSKEYCIALPPALSCPDHMPPQPISSSHPPSQHVNAFDHSSMAALLDPHLSSDMDLLPANLERMIFIGLWCVQPNPVVRPSMSVVVQMMEGVVDVPPPPLQNPLWDTQEIASTSSSVSQPSTLFSYQSTPQESAM